MHANNKETADVNEKEDNVTTAKDNEAVNQSREQATNGQKLKCKECTFETNVPKYMKSHTKGSHSGQFICQRGCNIRFKLVTDLDKHKNSS